MSYQPLSRARIMQDDCTGKVAICLAPGTEPVPIESESGSTSDIKDIFPSYWEEVEATEVKEGYYIKSNGTFVAKTKSNCYIYTVEPNKYYYYNSTQGVGQALVAFDASGKVLQAINGNPSNISCKIKARGVYFTPAECVKIVLEDYDKTNTSLKGRGIGKLFKSTGFKSSDSILTGKKWATCGDSYTAGDWSNGGQGGIDKDGSDPMSYRLAILKTYPTFIEERTGITLYDCAKGGIDFTNASGASQPFSSTDTTTGFYYPNYSLIPTDSDYITLQFGLNERDVDFGTKGDTTNTTLWGAYDTVIKWFKTNIPKAKVGVIITDAWLPKSYRDELISICKYYALPYLDLTCYDSPQPNGCFTADDLITGYIDSTINSANRETWLNSEANNHPNLASHLARSYVVESFLKSL